MPIDTSIYQGGTLANPAGAFLQGMQLAQQQRMQQQDMQLRQQQGEALTEQRHLMAQDRELAIAKAQRDAAEEAKLRELFGSGQPVSQGAIFSIVGPQRGAEILKGLGALQEQNAKAFTSTQQIVGTVIPAIKALPEGLRADAYTSARQSLLQRGVIQPQDAPEQYTPEFLDQALQAAMSPQQQYEAGQPKYTNVAPGGVVIDEKHPQAGPVYTAPKPEQRHVVTVPGPNGQPIQKSVTDAELAQGIPAWRDPKEPKEQQRFWVMRDGKPIRVTEAEYTPGDLPANTREQGRPVTSGDAGKIADFDTSLDDLNTLTGTIAENGATGTSAAVGAALPNWVTNWTGVGADAKSKQAVIDRVKQVIGKALEGGVLRKEDEAKYGKILPTISDAPEVVKTKLDGLWTAITKRRQTQLDALADAGYDVTKYAARPERVRAEPGAKPAGATAKTNPFR
jgi:hypothetical protein